MKTIAQRLNVTEFPFKIEDKDGKEIYYENSRGYWRRREYDSDGNATYYEESNGFWYKYEYDSNGNRIYFEDSNGIIENNRPTQSCDGKIVQIDGKNYKLTEL